MSGFAIVLALWYLKPMKLLILLVSFLLVGCASTTPYQKANYLGFGYRSTMIDARTARVSFKGNKITERADVELMLFYRAAEQTQLAKFQYFKFLNSSTDKTSTTESTTPQAIQVVRTARGRVLYLNGANEFNNPWSAVWGGTRGGLITYNQFEAVGLITMSNKPESEGTFKASEVLENLKTQIKFPEAK